MGKNSTKSYGYLWYVECAAFTKEQEKQDGNFPTAPYSNLEDKSVFNLALVVKTIVTTEGVRKIVESFGAELIDTLTGFKYIGEKIKEFEETNSNSFIFGLEESYGYNK